MNEACDLLESILHASKNRLLTVTNAEYDKVIENIELFLKKRETLKNFCGTLLANLDNEKLTDKEFKIFVRNSIDIVAFPRRCYHFDTKKEYDLANDLQRVLKEEKCKRCNGTGYHT